MAYSVWFHEAFRHHKHEISDPRNPEPTRTKGKLILTPWLLARPLQFSPSPSPSPSPSQTCGLTCRACHGRAAVAERHRRGLLFVHRVCSARFRVCSAHRLLAEAEGEAGTRAVNTTRVRVFHTALHQPCSNTWTTCRWTGIVCASVSLIVNFFSYHSLHFRLQIRS